MSLYISTWSVSSVFNRWNVNGVHFDPVVEIDQPNEDEQLSSFNISCTDDCVNIVADVIRDLGYIVKCGIHHCENTISSYIIMDIQTSEGEYVYGCSSDDAMYMEKRVHCSPLIGNRTIWEWAYWQTNNQINNETDLKEEICDDDIINAINCGGKYFSENSQVSGFYPYRSAVYPPSHRDAYPSEVRKWHDQTGFSTIGNTLPYDIVEALRDFRHDDIAFREDIYWEFYIPDFMQNYMACPVSEQNDCNERKLNQVICTDNSFDNQYNSSSDDD